MTRTEAIEKLRACVTPIVGGALDGEPCADHEDADQVLCDLLRSLGYGDVVDAYEAVQPKFYT